MRVPHLTDLLTWEEIWACQDVYRSGQGGGFGPIRLRLPDEISGCGDKANGKSYHVEHYSAKVRYAKELRRLAETAVCAATGAEPERVEWVPASVSFNTIRYPNLDAGAYVHDVMREMERLADAGTLSVQMGIRFLGTLKSEDGEEREQLEIVHPEFNRRAAGLRLEELLKPGAVEEKVFSFRWAEVANSFTVLSPMQVAFLHEEQMHRHTTLDDELFHACEIPDEAGIRTALEKGANIHAISEYGESVCATLVEAFNLWQHRDPDDAAHNPAMAERLLRLLLDHGADLDLAGAGEYRALHFAIYCASWMTELLLRLGADPNEPCGIDKCGYDIDIQTPMDAVWDEQSYCSFNGHVPDDRFVPDSGKMERILFRYGGGEFFMRDERAQDILDEIEVPSIDSVKTDPTACIQRKLLEATANLAFLGVFAAVRFGAQITGKDHRGRNLVQIALEDSKTRKQGWADREPNEYSKLLTNFVLFLLGYMRLPMETEDWRRLAETCRRLGETDLLAELEGSPLFGTRFREAVGIATKGCQEEGRP